MYAKPGQRLIVGSRWVGEPERDAKILEVRGPDGTPPSLIQWSDNGRVGLLYPGPDARVEPGRARRTRGPR